MATMKQKEQQGELKPIRDYNLQPRRYGELDSDHRGDLGDFEVSRTKQSDAESADINFIVSRHTAMEIALMGDTDRQMYGDFSDVGSFQEALEIVNFAQQQFNGLDAKVRARFNNDPAQMLEFVGDPANQDEMVKLGLAVARPSKEELISESVPDVRSKKSAASQQE